MKKLSTLLIALCLCANIFAIEPDGTYLYANKDGKELYLDFYNGRGPETGKPAVLFMFGGGFRSGARDKQEYLKWFEMLTGKGYDVISIDYRLGLAGYKGAGKNFAFIKATLNAIKVAVEDLYSATNFIIANAGQLGINPNNIVISGSSAGAISVMQAEWHICNHDEIASVLPAGFNYAGVMSFAGAIFSTEGAVKYESEPCPTLMLHGTADKMVEYDKMQILKYCFAGTNAISKVFLKNHYNCNILRFDGRGHEISAAMVPCFDEELRFLETNIEKGIHRTVDAIIDDPSIETPDWAKDGFASLYD